MALLSRMHRRRLKTESFITGRGFLSTEFGRFMAEPLRDPMMPGRQSRDSLPSLFLATIRIVCVRNFELSGITFSSV